MGRPAGPRRWWGHEQVLTSGCAAGCCFTSLRPCIHSGVSVARPHFSTVRARCHYTWKAPVPWPATGAQHTAVLGGYSTSVDMQSCCALSSCCRPRHEPGPLLCVGCGLCCQLGHPSTPTPMCHSTHSGKQSLGAYSCFPGLWVPSFAPAFATCPADMFQSNCSVSG